MHELPFVFAVSLHQVQSHVCFIHNHISGLECDQLGKGERVGQVLNMRNHFKETSLAVQGSLLVFDVDGFSLELC
jgi:hypothetical protein